MRDHAVGQDVEIELGEVPGITSQIALLGEDRRWRRYRLTVTNDRDVPVAYQAVFYEYPENMRFAARLGRRRGWPCGRSPSPPTAASRSIIA